MQTKSSLVISGVSGRYPGSVNVEEFWSNLLRGVELCTLDERSFAQPNSIPIGKIEDLESFDADLFGISDEMASDMGSFARKTIEVIYEAIYDTGILLHDWHKRKTCLFFAHWSVNEEKAHKTRDYYSKSDSRQILDYVCSVFDIRGGAALVDTACASSGTALECAIKFLESGYCDQAIVAACNPLTYHESSGYLKDLNMISKDGLSKCLDASADGFGRSEGIVAITVQRSCDAKRVYAKILNIKTNCDGYKPKGIIHPNSLTQTKLFETVLKELSLDPLRIDYIEGHLTGTRVGDATECASIKAAYRPDSVKPIYLGCLKSNISHGEGVAFLNAISKVVKIFQTGLIPANKNYRNPNPRIDGLVRGILVPILENTPFNGDLIPIHALGFGGVNIVTILEANPKRVTEQDKVLSVSGLPRLIQFCNRNYNGLETIVKFINDSKSVLTKYTLALLNDMSKSDPFQGFDHRGYLLLDHSNSIKCQEFQKVNQVYKVWFIFTPILTEDFMKYQELMALPNIRHRLESLSIKMMKSNGINLIEMINKREQDFTSRLVASIAMQIALYDFISKDLHILPEGIIGHSLGSIAAAYADNCLSDERAILIAYYVGSVCSTEFIKNPGLMMEIHLPFKQVMELKCNGIDISSHESENCTIISGSKDSVDSFIMQIGNEVASKKLRTENIPFHSSFFDIATEALRQKLAEVNIQDSYSSNISFYTPILKNGQNLVNSDFFVNLLKSQCYLQEFLQKLSKDSLKIAIGDTKIDQHQTIALLGNNVRENQIDTLLQQIGKLYLCGLNPAIENLYEKVTYPVPRETQSLSHLIKWNHDKKWNIPEYQSFSIMKRLQLSECINLDEQDYAFITGHQIDNCISFPVTGYLYLAWKLICKKHCLNLAVEHALELYDVHIHQTINFEPSTSQINISMKVNEDMKSFITFVDNENNICVTGRYKFVDKPSIDVNDEYQTNSSVDNEETESVLHSKDLYKELKIRGYDYYRQFQGVHQASSSGKWGLIKDTGHWITFSNSCLQVCLMATRNRKLVVPKTIEYVYMNPMKTKSAYSQVESTNSISKRELKLTFDELTGIAHADGFIMKGLTFIELQAKHQVPGTKREYQLFDPFESDIKMDTEYQAKLEQYMSYCLICIETLKGYQRLKDSNQYIWSIEDLLSVDDKSHSLLKLLYKFLQTNDGNKIEKIRHWQQKNGNDLLSDLTFLGPLEYLIQRSIAVVFECFFDERINAIAYNFLTIPSEVALNNEGLFSRINVKIEYVVEKNHTNIVSKIYNSMYKILNLMLIDKIAFEESNLIIVRDSSTYLPIIAPKPVPEFDTNQSMRVIYNSLKEGGFCIMITRTNLTDFEQEFYQLLGTHYDITFNISTFKLAVEKIGFTWIGFKHLELQGYCSILLRRPFTIKKNQKISIIRTTLNNFNWIDKIKEASKDRNHKIWLVGGGYDNGIIGLTKSLNRDPFGYNIRCFYDPSKADDEEIVIPDNILSKDYLINYVDKNGKIGTFIHLSIENLDDIKVETEHCYADIKTRGDLSSIRWFEAAHAKCSKFSTEKQKLRDNEILTIYFSALNTNDILLSTAEVFSGRTSVKPGIGTEFSGVDSEGNRIMGLCESGSLGSSISVNQNFIKFLVPDEWTLEEAATIPFAYLTAYYCLIIRGDLESDETVLIHDGSEEIGQAAIAICLARNCKVFTTVENQDKREFIKQQFPSMNDQHIGDSQSTSFEEMILRMTDGKGVDLILNSLTGDKMVASLRCLSDFGRFIETGKYDSTKNTLINRILMDTNKSFHACCLAHLLHEYLNSNDDSYSKIWHNLKQIFEEGIKSGVVKPLRRTIFAMDRLEEAFRYMTTGKPIGKVLIQIRNENETKLFKANGQSFFTSDKVYIITGGLGGIGIEVAYWMSQRGANNLILTSRSKIRNSYQNYMIEKIQKNANRHINVIISNEDCYTSESTERLINMAEKSGPIGGIFHLAMVLKDAFFVNQTKESFMLAVKPKAMACRNLDKLTRLLPYKLDFFVCFSSVSTIIGFYGQSNYCFGNSAMEQVCLKRNLDGHHGIAIQLGLIGDTGVVADVDHNSNYFYRNFKAMRLPQLLQTIDKLLLTSYSVCSAVITSDNELSMQSGEESLEHMIMNILGIKNGQFIDSSSTLRELGLDSLMAIEIKQKLEMKYDFTSTTQGIRDFKLSSISEMEKKFRKK